jgi:maltoporin
MTYQFNSLYGYQTNLPGSGHADWYSFVNYGTYQWRANLQSNCRVEFFDDVNGNRTGYEGLYTAGTMGLAYTPQRSIILRPEVRFDHNASSRPFAGQPDLFTAAFDVIVRW